jgi:hypothetical protein
LSLFSVELLFYRPSSLVSSMRAYVSVGYPDPHFKIQRLFKAAAARSSSSA